MAVVGIVYRTCTEADGGIRSRVTEHGGQEVSRVNVDKRPQRNPKSKRGVASVKGHRPGALSLQVSFASGSPGQGSVLQVQAPSPSPFPA